MQIQRKESYVLYDVLIFFILFTAPFTALRVWKIGITEITTLALIAIVLIQNFSFRIKHLSQFVFTKFWLITLAFMGVGTLIYFLFFQVQKGHLTLFIGDWFAYISAFLLCFSLEILIDNQSLNLKGILKTLFYCQSIFFIFLYVLSQRMTSIGPFVLRNWGFFQPLASNQHHASISIMALPFLGFWLLENETNIWKELFILLLILLNIFMGFDMNTGALFVGLSVGLFLLVYTKCITIYPLKKYLVPILLMSVLVAFLVAIIFFDQITSLVRNFFIKEDGGGIRVAIWMSNLEQVKLSPLFGLGPGGHTDASIYGKPFDAHQSFLTLLIQGGIITLFAFILLLFKVLRGIKRNIPLLIGTITVLSYLFSSDITRRMFVWTFLIIVFYYVKSEDTQAKARGMIV